MSIKLFYLYQSQRLQCTNTSLKLNLDLIVIDEGKMSCVEEQSIHVRSSLSGYSYYTCICVFSFLFCYLDSNNSTVTVPGWGRVVVECGEILYQYQYLY